MSSAAQAVPPPRRAQGAFEMLPGHDLVGHLNTMGGDSDDPIAFVAQRLERVIEVSDGISPSLIGQGNFAT